MGLDKQLLNLLVAAVKANGGALCIKTDVEPTEALGVFQQPDGLTMLVVGSEYQVMSAKPTPKEPLCQTEAPSAPIPFPSKAGQKRVLDDAAMVKAETEQKLNKVLKNFDRMPAQDEMDEKLKTPLPPSQR